MPGLAGAFAGRRGALFALLLYAGITVATTWPIAVTLDQATGLRGDYFNNIWNAWWMRDSLTEGHSPWATEYLYHPEGLSLKRHTLSPVNAFLGALLGFFLGPHAVFNVVLLGTFLASAWTFFLFARYVTGSPGGAVLAGLVYSFNPFHYYYVCQTNVFTFEFVPLALLFFLKTLREGGRRNTLLAALFSGLVAASTEYYAIYVYITVGLLVVLARVAVPEVPWRVGARRTVVAALVGAVAVCVGVLPFLLASLTGEVGVYQDTGAQVHRTNDLLGYQWLGGPEKALVSWPTMLGYSVLTLLLVSVPRLWRRQRFWLALGFLFLLLGLGTTLSVNGVKYEGVPMPYALVDELPILTMMRKSDRAFMMIQLVCALLVAEAWSGLAARIGSPGARRAAWLGCALVFGLELTGAPYLRFDYDPPAHMEALAADGDVDVVLELPPMDIDTANARYLLAQTVHQKKMPLGYCTALALSEANRSSMQEVVNGYVQFIGGAPGKLVRWVRENGVDRIIHRRTMPRDRRDNEEIADRTLWAPFFLVRKDLIGIRQMGRYVDQPIVPETMRAFTALLAREFGLPVHEDQELVVFEVSR